MTSIHLTGMTSSHWEALDGALRPADGAANQISPDADSTLAETLARIERVDFVLIGYADPSTVLAEALAAGEDLDTARRTWVRDAHAALDAVNTHPEKLILLHVRGCLADPDVFQDNLQLRTGLSFETGAMQSPAQNGLHFLDLTDSVSAADEEISTLLADLEGAALVTSQRAPRPDIKIRLESARAEFEARRRDQVALEALAQALKDSVHHDMPLEANEDWASISKQDLNPTVAMMHESAAQVLEHVNAIISEAERERREALNAAQTELEARRRDQVALETLANAFKDSVHYDMPLKANKDWALTSQQDLNPTVAMMHEAATKVLEHVNATKSEVEQERREIANEAIATTASLNKETLSTARDEVSQLEREAAVLREAFALLRDERSHEQTKIVSEFEAGAPAENFPDDQPRKRRLKWVTLVRDYLLLKSSSLFDGRWYLEQYPDLAGMVRNPTLHYLLHGGFEGRAASRSFCSYQYLEYYPDVRAAGMNPLVHYIRLGRKEGRLLFPLYEAAES